jgi:hypothetical protein
MTQVRDLLKAEVKNLRLPREGWHFSFKLDQLTKLSVKIRCNNRPKYKNTSWYVMYFDKKAIVENRESEDLSRKYDEAREELSRTKRQKNALESKLAEAEAKIVSILYFNKLYFFSFFVIRN